MLLHSSSSAPREPPIREAPVKVPRRWSLWPRLELYLDRLELTEWWGWRRVWCRLPLDALDRVDAPTPARLALRTGEKRSDCAPLTLKLPEAEQWAHTIRAFRACLDDAD